MSFAGRIGTVAALLVASMAWLSPNSKAQGRYSYTVVHDLGLYTNSVHTRSAAINNAGQVAFIHEEGVYRSDGGVLTEIYKLIVLKGGAVPPGSPSGQLSLNDTGVVAFHGQAGVKYIAVGDGTASAKIVAGWPAFAGVEANPSINNAGEVAFANSAGFAVSEVWVAGGGAPPRRIASPGMSLDGGTVISALSPSINDSGHVAFAAKLNNPTWNVYRSFAGVPTRIATQTDHLLAHINRTGSVVFAHGLDGLGIGNGGPVDHIKPPPFRSVYRNVGSLNDAGEVAFMAGGYPNGAQGVFVGTPAGSRPVIEPGDTIDGLGTVVHAYVGNDAHNNRGQVAFIVEYKRASDTTERRHAVVRADPADVDSDDDGVADENDAFPNDPAETRDTDRDGTGDNADPDDDGDGQSDADESACGSDPRDSTSQSPDRDFDGLPDCVDDHTPPDISVPPDMTVEAAGPNGSIVAYQVSALDDRDPQPSIACEPASGATFPLGETTVMCTATDASGNTDVGRFIVRVVDTTAPSIGDVRPSGSLWPPNGKMVDVTITVSANDTVDPAPVCTVVGVTANEPIDATDWALGGPLALQLRARRSGTSKEGRIYSVSIRCVDASQNAAKALATFVVAHDQRR